MATIDAFTYNGEREILDIRLNILDEYVDRFIIVEAKTTFTGRPKPLYFSLQERFFERFWHKIDYHVIDENYTRSEVALARESPNTKGAKHWVTEFLQKESILKALKYFKVQDADTVYIGDVDEIWKPYKSEDVVKLKLIVYAYYLNNRSNEEFWGPIVGSYENIKGECLNHLRTRAVKTRGLYGWHFTSMGGLTEVKRKLNDTYTSESYNTSEVQQLLPYRVKEGIDYLGRNFQFWIDESEWPEYLVEYKFKYMDLCKPTPKPSFASIAGN